MTSLGHIAYDAFLAHVRANKTIHAPPLPEWDGLADYLKSAWEAAVVAVTTKPEGAN